MLKLKRSLSLFAVCIVPCLLAAGLSTPAAQASFGFKSVEFSVTERPTSTQEGNGELGVPDTQAGSHPYQLTASFIMNTRLSETGLTIPDEDVKDVYAELPPGLVGDTNAVPQCGIKEFETLLESPPEGSSYANSGSSCSANTQVGIADIRLRVNNRLGNLYQNISNLVPPPGSPAQFGFSPLKIPVVLRPTVRTGGDYGLTIAAQDISQFEPVGGTTLTFWGVPADAGHDPLRGECLAEGGPFPMSNEGRSCPASGALQPFLTLPTNCTAGPLQVTFVADSWERPGSYNADGTPDLSDPNWVRSVAPLPAMKGCEKPVFKPALTTSPDTAAADTPAGLTVEVKTAQDGLLNPGGIAAADIQDTTVALPAGMAINPGQAAGLAACQPGQDGVGSELPQECPAASKVGTDEAETPLLRDALKGSIYVLQSNPPNLELLLVFAGDGVEVKLPIKVHADAVTGQLTTTVTGIPQFPLSDIKLAFSGGPQAALTTPPTCGSYTTTSVFLPWSAPFSPDFPILSSFEVTTGPGGTACASPLPFAPEMIAGATTDQAGAHTNFSFLLQRGDGQQRVSSLRFKTPAGLLAYVGSVPLCDEADANAGTCPTASQIGHTVVTAGPGSAPLVVPQPGQPPAPVYLTGGYEGAPYGLSIVVPLVVGPFTLQTQVVRASIAVDPRTSQLTITPDPLPQVVDGIPTDLRTIDTVIDRAGFMINPTSCSPQTFSGTALSTQGASAPLASAFQVGSCQSLKYQPKLTVTTSGHTSKANGASLTATLTNPNDTPGVLANTALVKVALPRQLPSRLTTLQKACLAATFNANPASCPAASVVGYAHVSTPILPGTLTGPAFFVSHGGEAFPSLEVMLQGDGVTAQIEATTFISKQGVTTLTFKQTPDVPFTSFALTSPQGKYSALAANLPPKTNGSFCGQKLTMPAEFVGQNGLVVKQTEKIGVTGCPPARPRAKQAKRPSKQANTSDRRTHR